MEIKSCGSQPSILIRADCFTGHSRINQLFNIQERVSPNRISIGAAVK